MRFLLAVVLAAGITALVSSCFDPPPGEISIIATKSGQRAGCGVQLFNSKGVQIDQTTTDMQGLVYLRNIVPGNYTLKFVDRDGNLYPPVVDVNIEPGEQETIRVDLDKETPVEGSE